MDALILRFPDERQSDVVLDHGVHALGRDDNGGPCCVEDVSAAVAQICVDRRGVWLKVREGANGLHVNGRPVRRMAMLRAGDAVYFDGVELVLMGPRPSTAPPLGWPRADGETPGGDRRVVLRGLGGAHHGRCFWLDRELTIGAANSDIRLGDAEDAIASVRLEPHPEGVILRGSQAAASYVNGWPVRDALLRPGDQLMLDAQHRFVLETPSRVVVQAEPSAVFEDLMPADGDVTPRGGIKASARRLPWLLLAALLLAGALSLLLLYGVR